MLRSVKITAYGQQYADNQSTSFLPAIVSTSTRMHGEFLRLLFLQAHRETEAHFTAEHPPPQCQHQEAREQARAGSSSLGFWVQGLRFRDAIRQLPRCQTEETCHTIFFSSSPSRSWCEIEVLQQRRLMYSHPCLCAPPPSPPQHPPSLLNPKALLLQPSVAEEDTCVDRLRETE